MAVFGHLFVLTGLYFFWPVTRAYREGRYTAAIGHTAGAFAFIVGGLAKVYGAERDPTVVVIFLFLVTVGISAYVSADK